MQKTFTAKGMELTETRLDVLMEKLELDACLLASDLSSNGYSDIAEIFNELIAEKLENDKGFYEVVHTHLKKIASEHDLNF